MQRFSGHSEPQEFPGQWPRLSALNGLLIPFRVPRLGRCTLGRYWGAASACRCQAGAPSSAEPSAKVPPASLPSANPLPGPRDTPRANRHPSRRSTRVFLPKFSPSGAPLAGPGNRKATVPFWGAEALPCGQSGACKGKSPPRLSRAGCSARGAPFFPRTRFPRARSPRIKAASPPGGSARALFAPRPRHPKPRRRP